MIFYYEYCIPGPQAPSIVDADGMQTDDRSKLGQNLYTDDDPIECPPMQRLLPCHQPTGDRSDRLATEKCPVCSTTSRATPDHILPIHGRVPMKFR